MKKIILIISAGFFITSCSTAYKISDNNEVYQTESDVDDEIRRYQIEENSNIDTAKISIKENDDHLIIKGIPRKNYNPDSTLTINGNVRDYRQELEGDHDNATFYYPDASIKPEKSFIYYSWNLNLSAAIISIKNRYKIRPLSDPTVQDSFPATYSTGFAPTFTLGLNRSINWYTPNAKKYELGFTLGAFYGFGTTTIDKNTTRESVYQHSRTALYHSFGGFFNVGFQKFDLGIAFGIDHATGPGSPSWVYQNQPFYGIILGYDIVKFKK